MDKVTQVNIEGHNYGFVAGQAVKGSCTSNAGDWVKTIVLPEGAELTEGMVVATLFLNTNSVGFSDPITIYSATGNVYYYDPQMTEPVTLPPYEDCYIIEHVSGTEYTYQAFPVAVINGERVPVCDSRGRPCGGPIWSGGDTIASLYLDDKLLMLHSTTVDQVITGSTLPVTSGAVAQTASALASELSPVNEVAVGNMKAVTSNAVANALSWTTGEKVVGEWLGHTMYESMVGYNVATDGQQTIPVGVTGILTVVEYSGVYIKGTWQNASFVMNIPYTFHDKTNNLWLQIYAYFDNAANAFQVLLNGTYSNVYYAGGQIYIKFRYIKS